MTINTVLGRTTADPFTGTPDGMLVVFLDHGDVRPPHRLTDPRVLGGTTATGCWEIMFVTEPTGRAFYVRHPSTDDALTEARAADYLELGPAVAPDDSH